MDVEMNFEIGHTVRMRQGDENADYTHDWNAYVSEAHGMPIYTYVQAVKFYILIKGRKSSEVVTQPPFRVEASNYQNFELFVELHFRNPALRFIVFTVNVNLPDVERIVQKRALKTYIFKDLPYELGAQLLYYGGKDLTKSVMLADITARKPAFHSNSIVSNTAIPKAPQSFLLHSSTLRPSLPLAPIQPQLPVRLLPHMNARNKNCIARQSINSFPKNLQLTPVPRRISLDEYKATRAIDFMEPTRKRLNISNSIITPQSLIFHYEKEIQSLKELLRNNSENFKNTLSSITTDNKAVQKNNQTKIHPIQKGAY